MGLLINIVGKPKTGKTVSACTFPKPIVLLDFDLGFASVQNAKNKDGTLVVPDHAQVTPIQLFKKQAAPLDFKSWQLVKGGATGPAPEHAKEAMPVLEMYNKMMADLAVDGCLVNKEGKKVGPFKTVIIDPTTAMYRLWKDGILFVNKVPELRRGDYLTLEGVLARQFIPNLQYLSSIVSYVICISHEDFDQSDTGTLTGEYSVGPTKNLGKNMSEYFDEVWRMEQAQDGTYCWRTRNHGLFRGAGSRHHLPDPLKPATFAELSKHLK